MMAKTSCSFYWLFTVAYIVLIVACLVTAAEASTTNYDEDATGTTKTKVALVGLGAMGRSVLQCLLSKGNGIEVHAWNRGAANRQVVVDLELVGVTVYKNVADAIAASDGVVFVVINSGKPNLDVVRDLVHQSKKNLEGKTLVNFVNHEPYAASDLDKLLEESNADHVAGSMFATPDIICTPGALVLTSAPARSTLAYREALPILNMLGRHEAFEGDVGYGSLVTIGLIQSLYFGLAGYELALLFLEKYGLASEEITRRFVELAAQTLPQFYSHFFKVIATSISERRWNENYVPAQDMLTLLEMHGAFLEKMGIVSDTFNSVYSKYLKAAVESEGHDVGISAVIKQYSVDGFIFENVASDEIDEL